jgi:hypothetical protein
MRPLQARKLRVDKSGKSKQKSLIIRILHQNRVRAVLMQRLRREPGSSPASRNAAHFGAASCRVFQFQIKPQYMFDPELE